MSDKPPVEEPQGYRCAKGFVKSCPGNNDYYVDLWKDDPWYPAIKLAHKSLTQLVPGYNIAQIKEKFGGLRYYISFPDGVLEAAVNPKWPGYDTPEKIRRMADGCIVYAAGWVQGYENANGRNIYDD